MLILHTLDDVKPHIRQIHHNRSGVHVLSVAVSPGLYATWDKSRGWYANFAGHVWHKTSTFPPATRSAAYSEFLRHVAALLPLRVPSP